MALRGIVRIWNRSLARAIFRCPLMRASRTLGQLPFVAEQVGEEVVAPLRGRRGPNDFQAASDAVSTMALAKFVLPPEALLLDGGTFRFVADIFRGHSRAVSLAEGVTTGNECNCFLVVHRHA